jgi:4-amino-4-deoxy-L-arabinose transferase-like glycosyltransferase
VTDPIDSAPTRSRLGVSGREWAALVSVLILTTADRFVNLPSRFIWDTDQGVEVGAIWNAVVTRQLPALGSPAFTTGGTFHHGALFYDLMIPFAWLSNGNPTVLAVAIAFFGCAVVPLVWWTARSIGGTSAGLATALLAGVSPSLIDYSTFIWNPVLVEFGVALACFGAWQAWTRGPRWWVVAAAGTAIASQSHLTGLALVFPMAILFVITLKRAALGTRRRLLAWGVAGAGLFLLTWAPWIAYELTHGFAETRGILTFTQGNPPPPEPLARYFISSVRMLAWPMTRWPLDDFQLGFPVALAVAVGVAAGMVWRVTGAVTSGRTGHPQSRPTEAVTREHQGLIFVGGSLLLMVGVLALAVPQLSQVSNINQEQYHVVVDVLVILATGLIVSGLWRSTPLPGRRWSGQALGLLTLAGFMAVGIAHWPPLTAPDGGYPAAHAAAARLEADSGAPELAVVNLPDFKGADAYIYPLGQDGVKIVAPADAETLVILCDSGWYEGCSGSAESGWIASNLPGRKLTLVDRFEAAPKRFLSVYRTSP